MKRINEISLDCRLNRIHSIGSLGSKKDFIVLIAPVIDMGDKKGGMYIEGLHSVQLVLTYSLSMDDDELCIFLQRRIVPNPFDCIQKVINCFVAITVSQHFDFFFVALKHQSSESLMIVEKVNTTIFSLA